MNNTNTIPQNSQTVLNSNINLQALNRVPGVNEPVARLIDELNNNPNKCLSSTNNTNLADFIELISIKDILDRLTTELDSAQITKLRNSLPDETKKYIEEHTNAYNLNSHTQLSSQIVALIKLPKNRLCNPEDYNEDKKLLDSIDKNNYTPLYALLANYLADAEDTMLYEHVKNIINTIIFYRPEVKKQILEALKNQLGVYGNHNPTVKKNAQQLISYLEQSVLVLPSTPEHGLSCFFNKLDPSQQPAVIQSHLMQDTLGELISKIHKLTNVPEIFNTLNHDSMTIKIAMQENLKKSFNKENIDTIINNCNDPQDVSSAEALIEYIIAYHLNLLEDNKIHNMQMTDHTNNVNNLQNKLNNNPALHQKILLITTIMNENIEFAQNFDIGIIQKSIKTMMTMRYECEKYVQTMCYPAFYEILIKKLEPLHEKHKSSISKNTRLDQNNTKINNIKPSFMNSIKKWITGNPSNISISEAMNFWSLKNVDDELKLIKELRDVSISQQKNLLNTKQPSGLEYFTKNQQLTELTQKHEKKLLGFADNYSIKYERDLEERQTLLTYSTRIKLNFTKEDQQYIDTCREQVIDFITDYNDKLPQQQISLANSLRNIPYTDSSIFALMIYAVTHPGVNNNDEEFKKMIKRCEEYIEYINGSHLPSINIQEDTNKKRKIADEKEYLKNMVEVYRYAVKNGGTQPFEQDVAFKNKIQYEKNNYLNRTLHHSSLKVIAR